MALYVGNKKYCVVKKIGVNNVDVQDDIRIQENGTYSCSDFGEDYTGIGVVEVDVQPPLEAITINPSTETQTITPTVGKYGINRITVNPVTSSFDANIQPGNILHGVTILGVTGTINYEDTRTVTPTISQQVITPASGYNGLASVTVNAVTSAIDSNIQQGNIKNGVTILGVTGTVVELKGTTATITQNGTYTPTTGKNAFTEVTVSIPLESLTITPTINTQTITHDNHGGYNSITVNPVTAAIDSDIKPENILSGVNILGVDGGIVLDNTTIDPSINTQTITHPLNGTAHGGYETITVNPVTSSIDSDIAPENILDGVDILGVTGKIVLDSTTINPSTTTQTITHPKKSGVDGGYKTITVNPVTAAIDPDIIATNIRKGVNILGVDGSIDFEALNVTPSTVAQSFTPTKDGYNSVTVAAVTSAIDADIIPANIMSGVNILGVDGAINFTTKTVNPATTNQTYTPPTGVNAFSSFTVNAVTSDIDANILEGNIKKDVTILGVTGTYEPDVRALTVNPSVQSQVFTPSDFDGYSTVTVNAVPASIDIDISPENIRDGIDVLGVVGTLIELQGETREVTLTNKAGQTFTPVGTGKNAITSITVTPNNQAKTIAPSTSSQTITVPNGYSGFGTLTVNPVTSAIDANILASNIKSGVTILGVTGTVTELVGQTKTGANKITSNGTYTPDTGYNGFTEIEIDINTVNNQSLSVTQNGTYRPEEGYTGFDEVVVEINTVNNTSLSVTPTTNQQILSPQSPYTGYGTVTVAPVTAAIDANIVAGNIKSGVTILGVTGNVTQLTGQTKTFTADANTATVTTVTPDSGYNGITSLTIDLSYYENRLAAINGTGNVDVSPHVPQTLTITQNGTYTPDTGYTEFDRVIVNVNAVNNTSLSVTPTTSQQTFTAASPYTGYGTVTVAAVTNSIDSNIVASNIKNGVTILGVTGTAEDINDLLSDDLDTLTSGVTTVRPYACYYATELETVTLDNATIIGDNAFAQSGLTTLIINTSTLCSLSNVNALYNTPIANGTGYIYVPNDLVNTYKAETNWEIYANRIRSISDLT